MNPSNALRMYESLEKEILRLDEEGDAALADRLRDLLDFVWRQRLSKDERQSLNSREHVAVKP